jgi:hypothetical protein
MSRPLLSAAVFAATQARWRALLRGRVGCGTDTVVTVLNVAVFK